MRAADGFAKLWQNQGIFAKHWQNAGASRDGEEQYDEGREEGEDERPPPAALQEGADEGNGNDESRDRKNQDRKRDRCFLPSCREAPKRGMAQNGKGDGPEAKDDGRPSGVEQDAEEFLHVAKENATPSPPGATPRISAGGGGPPRATASSPGS